MSGTTAVMVHGTTSAPHHPNPRKLVPSISGVLVDGVIPVYPFGMNAIHESLGDRAKDLLGGKGYVNECLIVDC